MGPLWKNTFKDLDFIQGVSFTGMINGILIILPRILAHGEGGHVVSTASQSGLYVVPGAALYCAIKAGTVGLMETLACDLRGTNVGASAFCPGPVMGNLSATSKEVRPAELQNDSTEAAPPPPPPPTNMEKAAPMFAFSKLRMTAEEAGARVVRGILRNDLYILTHPRVPQSMQKNMKPSPAPNPDQPLKPDIRQPSAFLTQNPSTRPRPGPRLGLEIKPLIK
jgi:NAD(P)-dependent dehydrogenase (short-subunit alcohol dehydrogenase family)